MNRRLLIIFGILFIFSIISCSDNGTGSDPEEGGAGILEITTITGGSNQDSDAYILTVDGSEQSIGVNETVTIEYLSEGSYEAELSGIADNCSVEGENPRQVEVFPEDFNSTTFEVSCESESSGGGLPSELNNKIVFGSDRDGNDDIFVMNTDGSNQQKMTDNPEFDRHPVVSNDGTKIAFVSNRNGAINIYTMDADGSNIQQVTQSFDMPFYPHLSWSPDDSKIAFYDKRSGNDDPVNGGEGFYNEIYTINTDGSDLTRLTDNDAFDGFPDWSSDGDNIVFTSRRDGGINSGQEIYTMNADGSDPQRITDDEATNSEPRWSPDGSEIVFETDRNSDNPGNGGGDLNIYVMNSDGTDLLQVTNNAAQETNPAWSADGTEIIFVTNRDINREIYKINDDGSGSPANLTENGAMDEAPFWGPAE